MSEVGDIISIAGFVLILVMSVRLDRRFSPEGIANLAKDAYTSFRMSITGKEGVYVKKKGKLDSLMQEFVIEDLAPDLAENALPGIPPLVVKFIVKKLNESELGDFLKENPEMTLDALSMAGQMVGSFSEGSAAGNLATPRPEGSTDGWF